MKWNDWKRKQHKIENLSEVMGLEHLRNALVEATLMLFKALRILKTLLIRNKKTNDLKQWKQR